MNLIITILSFLVFILFISTFILQWKVRSTIKKANKQEVSVLSGGEAVRKMLEANHVSQVKIIQGDFDLGGEFYDPKSRSINLSPEAMMGRTSAAVAIATHEAGHAVQHATGNTLMKIRSKLVPPLKGLNSLANIVVVLTLVSLFTGIFRTQLNAYYIYILYFWAILFGATLIFEMLTLPLEFDASRQAMKFMENNNMFFETNGLVQAKKVLKTAALTYILAFLLTLVQFIRIVLIILNDKR